MKSFVADRLGIAVDPKKTAKTRALIAVFDLLLDKKIKNMRKDFFSTKLPEGL